MAVRGNMKCGETIGISGTMIKKIMAGQVLQEIEEGMMMVEVMMMDNQKTTAMSTVLGRRTLMGDIAMQIEEKMTT